MIPDEAVEAAARVVAREMWRTPRSSDAVPLDITRAAIEAALPYLSDAARQPQRISPTDWPDLPEARMCQCTEPDPLPMVNGYCSDCNKPRQFRRRQ